MKNYNITFSRRSSTVELVSILFAVCALLFARLNKSTFAAVKSAWRWLFAPKTYFAGDGEGVVEQTLGGEGAACGVLRRGGVRRRYGVGPVDERRNYRNCISGCRSRHTGRN